jgi:hypothetical protein
MAIDPRAESPDPASPDPAAGTTPAHGRRPPWVAPLVGVVVLGVLAVAGMQVWRFTRPPQTATTKATPPAVTGRPLFTITGTVSRTGKDGQKQFPRDATVSVLQPMWTPDRQQQWEQRVNETLAKACRELGGGDPPPTVTADPASVRRADQAMARRQQAAKPASPWKHGCAAEFLALLKDNSIEASTATVSADGAFSVSTIPPAGISYIIHARASDAEWLDKLPPRANRLELDDDKLVRD